MHGKDRTRTSTSHIKPYDLYTHLNTHDMS